MLERLDRRNKRGTTIARPLRMLTSLARTLAVGALGLSLAACAGANESPTAVDDDEQVGVAEGGVAGQLKLVTLERSVRGIFQYDGGEAEIGIDTIGPEMYDLFVEVNGMHLTMLVDRNGGVIEMDGYAAANGKTTQMSANDRTVLRGIFVAMDKLGVDKVPGHVRLLRKMIDHWGEHSPTIALQRQKLFDAKKTVTSLCGSCGSFVSFTHDCNTAGTGADATTAYGYVKHLAAYSGCAEGTKWATSSGGTFNCLASEPGHSTSYEYGKGNCFARCGAGCGTEKDYTKDCGNHDHCVRFGHADASAYCNDQLGSCTDDEASAPTCTAC